MKLLLTNVVWDNTYKETRYFSNVNVRNGWFGLPDSLDDRQVNFNVGGDLLASCVINIDGSNLVRLNYNYLVVEDTANNDYLFYFINSCKYLNAKQIQYNLELDVITQYLPTIEQLPSHLFTAHVDRFKTPIPNEQLVYFDTSYQSKIWLEDIPNLAKRLKKKIPIKWEYIPYAPTINNWLNENILCWVYVFLTTKEYTINNQTTQRIRGFDYALTSNRDSKINPYLSCVAVPVMKTNSSVYLNINNTTTSTTKSGEVNVNSLYALLDRNNGNAHVHSYVISMQPPNRNNSNFVYSLSENDLEITTNVDDIDINTGNTLGLLIEEYYGLPIIRNFNLEPIRSYPVYTNELTYTTSFDKDFFKGFNFDDFIAEPKLSKMNVKEIQITSSFGNNFTLDGLKLLNDKQSIRFELYEPITPGTNASLVRPIFTDTNDGVYQTAYNNEIIGLLTNYDSTLPFATSYIDQFLASNKNFFMQKLLDIGITYGTGLVHGVAQMNSISTPVNVGTSIADYVRRGVDLQLTLDNMRNAPSTYRDSASNILLDLSILTDFGYYLEIWDALDIDKKIYLDNINHYGYVLNIEDDMTKYFHTRKIFNYVRGEIHSISNNLSNVVKNKIKYVFNNGIRLFHRDDFNDPYTQNYELSLED